MLPETFVTLICTLEKSWSCDRAVLALKPAASIATPKIEIVRTKVFPSIAAPLRKCPRILPLALTASHRPSSNLHEAPFFAPRQPRHLPRRPLRLDRKCVREVGANAVLRIVESRL